MLALIWEYLQLLMNKSLTMINLSTPNVRFQMHFGLYSKQEEKNIVKICSYIDFGSVFVYLDKSRDYLHNNSMESISCLF